MDKRMNDNLMENYEQEKSFGELDLVDDYMFDVVTEDLESCKLILELAMGIHIKEIRWRENQKVIHITCRESVAPDWISMWRLKRVPFMMWKCKRENAAIFRNVPDFIRA